MLLLLFLLGFNFNINFVTLCRPRIMPQILNLKKLPKHIRNSLNLFILYYLLFFNAVNVFLNLFLHNFFNTQILRIQTDNRLRATRRHFHRFDLVNFMSNYLWLGSCWFCSLRLNIFCYWRVRVIVNSWNYNLTLCVLAFVAVLY